MAIKLPTAASFFSLIRADTFWAFVFIPALFGYVALLQATVNQRPTLGNVERVSSEMDSLIPPDANLEIIADGNLWAEGPLWIKDDDRG